MKPLSTLKSMTKHIQIPGNDYQPDLPVPES